MYPLKNGLKSFVRSILENEIKSKKSVKQSKDISSLYKDATNLILSRDDLHKLECKAVRKYQLNAVKNMLVFSFYSGLKLEEILKLKKSNIKVLPNGSNALEIQRSDGRSNSLIPINERMSSIIHFYNGYHKNARKGKLFPTYSNDSINESLLYLSAFCRINKPLSFLMARRSYLVYEFFKRTSLETLQKNLGHKEIRSTRRYIKQLMREIYGATKFPSFHLKSHTNGK
jgi:integrase